MSPAAHPIRDGIVAVTLGAVLALLLLFGVRALQSPGASGGETGSELPVITPGTATDACELRGGGGGGGASEPDPRPGPDYPRQEFPLDTGRPVEVTGSGNAEIGYERLSEFATVVSFECAECSGDLTVFNTGTGVPILTGETIGEPVEVEWLIDTVHEQTEGPHNSLLIRAAGQWSLTLQSWYDLPIRSGTVDGSGSKVLRVEPEEVRLTFAPLNSRDMLNVYAYRLTDREFRASTCIGRRESQLLDLNGGQVLLIWARGDWTLETR